MRKLWTYSNGIVERDGCGVFPAGELQPGVVGAFLEAPREREPLQDPQVFIEDAVIPYLKYEERREGWMRSIGRVSPMMQRRAWRACWVN